MSLLTTPNVSQITVSSTNISGEVTLVAGTNITLTPSGQQITIAASGGGGSMAIGGSITSGTATRVLFEGAGPVLADDADFTFDSTNNRLNILNITGSATSGGDLTLTSTTHGTKGEIILDDMVNVWPSLTSISTTDIFHIMPTVTHTSGITNWFRISPTETMSGAGVITRVLYVDGTWTQSGASFGVFNMFYSAATFTTSDTNAPPAPLVFYNQTAYTIQHNVGTTSYTPTGFIDQQSFNATTSSANVTLNSSMISFSSTPVITVTDASATLVCGARIALNIADVAFTSTGSLTLTNNYGIKIADMVVGTSGNRTVTNVYGIHSSLTSGTNRWFIYSSGSADSVHTGELRLGDTTAPTALLDIIGKMTMDTNGLVTRYNNIATVSNGVPSILATVDLTAQGAAIATTTLYAVPASGAGVYRVNWYAKVTRAATTSSTMGALTITFTDPSGVAVTMTAAGLTNAGAIATTRTTNSTTNTGVLNGVPLVINANASTNIQYAMAYATAGGTSMQYTLRIKLEAL